MAEMTMNTPAVMARVVMINKQLLQSLSGESAEGGGIAVPAESATSANGPDGPERSPARTKLYLERK